MAHAWEFDVRAALTTSVRAGPDARRTALRVAAEAVLRAIKAVWPVDTGRSLAGFAIEPKGTSWIVYNDVEYTKYVHDGLATRTAQAATLVARVATNAALLRIVAREQTVGARGAFRLRGVRTLPANIRRLMRQDAPRAIRQLRLMGLAHEAQLVRRAARGGA
jgi:hypothetical protein